MNVQLERVGTGNREIDDILMGGFPVNSINIIAGQPGSGKTVFAEQIVFENARGDRPVLYVTTLSEPRDKIVRYLQTLDFFDPAMLTGAIIFEDVGDGLRANGIGHLSQYLQEMLARHAPKIIVIDSFKAVHDLATSPTEMRHLISELAGMLTAHEVTTFLIGEYSDDQLSILPEFAVADSVIELSRKRARSRDERFLRIVKLRGSGYVEGHHGFRITAAGLEVFPRLVTPEIPVGYVATNDRISSGVAGLDELLDGGIPRGSSTLLLGSAGAGKTTFALNFAMEGVRRGEPTLFANFQENPTQLARTIGALDEDLEAMRAAGLQLEYFSPVELQIDSIINRIFRAITESGVRRVVLDAATDLTMASEDRARLHEYIYSLLQHFAVNQVSSLLTFELQADTHGHPSSDEVRFSAVSDAILLLGTTLGEVPRRTLRIVKARGTNHDLRTQTFEITAKGITVLPYE